MTEAQESLARLRRDMVDRQLRRRGISHAGLLRAFAEVPRERFVPPDRLDEAYADHPVPIGHGQTISQPYVVALMLQELGPRQSDRVLDVGAGSGYQTALLSRLCRHVYAVERLEALTERAAATLGDLGVSNVTFCTHDGSEGWTDEAPFDRIVCGAAGPEIPQEWIDQLADGGRIVAPVGGPHVQTLVVVERDGDDLHRRKLCDVRFVKLIGRSGWPEGEGAQA